MICLKSQLRTHVKNILKTVPEDRFEAAGSVLLDRITSDPRWEYVTRVCSYKSYKREVSTDAFNAEVVKSGRGLFLPIVLDDRSMTMVPQNCFHDVRRGMTLIVVPGLAFSPEGHRLGRGWGCYDRFLEKLRRDPSVLTVGVGLRCQLFESIPHDDLDIPLQELIII
jgi:5-formyltetrahydrofolate cyclo-ligase